MLNLYERTTLRRLKQKERLYKKDKFEAIGCGVFGLLLVSIMIMYLMFL